MRAKVNRIRKRGTHGRTDVAPIFHYIFEKEVVLRVESDGPLKKINKHGPFGLRPGTSSVLSNEKL